MSWTGFPSPLGDSILITVSKEAFQKRAEAKFPSPLGDSILITGRRDRNRCPRASFRPLSGIQFSLPSTSSGVVKTWRRFPSPLGESILITRNEVSYEAAVALFPSPLGESILITNLTPHEITFIDDEGFRPLSGIQFSLRKPQGIRRL